MPMFVHNNYLILRLTSALLLSAFVGMPAAAHQAESTQPVILSATPVMATGSPIRIDFPVG